MIETDSDRNRQTDRHGPSHLSFPQAGGQKRTFYSGGPMRQKAQGGGQELVLNMLETGFFLCQTRCFGP